MPFLRIPRVLTGHVVQTQATGNKVVLDPDTSSIRIYDYNGEPIGALSGFVTFGLQSIVDGEPAQPTLALSPGPPATIDIGGALSTTGDLIAGGILRGQSVVIINNPETTGSGSANLLIGTDGHIRKITSSRRYKTRIRRLRDSRRILALRPVTFQDRQARRRLGKHAPRHWGFIAEDVHALGLTELVNYDEQGRPDSVQYDRVVVGLLDVVRDLAARLDAAGI